MQHAASHKPGKVHDWCHGRTKQTLSTLLRADGTTTGNIEEMDKALHAAWMPIFAKYSDANPEPPWKPFRDRFGKYIKKHPQPLSPLTADELRKTLARMSGSSAGGMEGWRPAELKALPTPLLTLLADVFNAIEATGEWPAALEKASITLIPKGNGGAPLDLRPISVTSAVYRLWAGTRIRAVMQWQEKWMTRGQMGFRAGCACDDVYWAMALRAERAMLAGETEVGLSADLAKAFDSIPHEIMFTLLEELGMHANLLRPLRGMYSRLRRRFKIAGAVGKEFKSTQGILQ
eukprot:gene3736-biopygen34283